MFNWTKKKFGFNKGVEILKAIKIDPNAITTDQQREQYFISDDNGFNPIINSDKRYIGLKNSVRMLLKLFQRYNYYCSRTKPRNREVDILCNNDLKMIEKYFKNNKNKSYNIFSSSICIDKKSKCLDDLISYSTLFDIYYLNPKLDPSSKLYDRELGYRFLKKYVGDSNSKTRFTPNEWDNIIYYFSKIRQNYYNESNLNNMDDIVKVDSDDVYTDGLSTARLSPARLLSARVSPSELLSARVSPSELSSARLSPARLSSARVSSARLSSELSPELSPAWLSPRNSIYASRSVSQGGRIFKRKTRKTRKTRKRKN